MVKGGAGIEPAAWPAVGSAPEPLFLSPLAGSLPAVQVLPQSLLPGGGLFPVRAVAENWIFVHVLGATGKHTSSFISYCLSKDVHLS